MQIATIKAETRKPGGRTVNRRLRREGWVPAVVYGHGETPETLSLLRHDLELALQHTAHVIKVDLDGKEIQFLIKEVQYDHLQHEPVHADLMRVRLDERVTVKVALDFRGEPHGIHEGGEFIPIITDLEVECPLLNIPESIRVKIDHLGVGQALHVSEIALPEGVASTHDPDDAVAVVRAKRGVSVEAEAPAEGEEAAAAEPEVIGRGSKEESEGEE